MKRGRQVSRLMVSAALAALAIAAPADIASATTIAPQPDQDTFLPPHGPLLLTRELRKTLVDGQEIISQRRYAVRFVPQGDGYRVEGELVGTAVQAPPELGQLADVERSRADEGLFPLILNRHGMIVEQQGANDAASTARTLAEAKAFLANSELSDADRSAALAMVTQLQEQARAAGGNWPADLFRPASGRHEVTRDIPLPDGSAGRVTVSITASDLPGGMLDRLQRRVITELNGTSRLSTETWTLAQLP